jgi:hypothetical protein
MSEDRLNEFLLAWQEHQWRGLDVQPAELCPNCPELAEELRKRIQVLQKIGALMQAAVPPLESSALEVARDTANSSILSQKSGPPDTQVTATLTRVLHFS